ncbi:MAG: LytTR family DNA-binding domain-containing protein [Acidobacteriota bacterium]
MRPVLRLLIVDDEPIARRRLTRMLESLDAVKVVGHAADGPTAVQTMRRLDPDVVLLDIQIPGLDGLGVARRIDQRPAILFITAHPEFALDAFDVAARDYLVKPVDPQRLARAIERVRSGVAGPDPQVTRENRGPAKVKARRGQSLFYFEPSEIDVFRATEKYVGFVHAGRAFLTDETLASLERRLRAEGFRRVHRNALVRTDAIRALTSHGPGRITALLDDGTEIPVSRRRAHALRARLDRGGRSI